MVIEMSENDVYTIRTDKVVVESGDPALAGMATVYSCWKPIPREDSSSSRDRILQMTALDAEKAAKRQLALHLKQIANSLER